MNLEGKYIKINSHHKMIVDELRKNGNKIYIDEMTYDYWGDSTILIYYKKIYNRLDWMFDGGEWYS